MGILRSRQEVGFRKLRVDQDRGDLVFLSDLKDSFAGVLKGGEDDPAAASCVKNMAFFQKGSSRGMKRAISKVFAWIRQGERRDISKKTVMAMMNIGFLVMMLSFGLGLRSPPLEKRFDLNRSAPSDST